MTIAGRHALFALLVAGCGEPRPAPSATPPGSTTDPVAAPATWPVPAQWRHETIPFPLDFAPALAHTGAEELRFPPGFFDPASPEYWSYVFTWRTSDPALLDAAALGAELTIYFRGLITAVDGDRKRITGAEAIVARATADGPRFTLTAHVFDAFKTALPVDLVGWAERRACATGALWTFVLAPQATSLRAELDALARAATCD